MPDVVDKATRSRMMAAIRSKNTKPEVALRKALFARGFRYRLHAKNLPGRPDIVLPRYRATVFVNGCFWHGHDCSLFRLPSTRTDFWRNKIEGNRNRDAKVARQVADAEWRQLVVWECAIKGRLRIGLDATVDAAAAWIVSENTLGVIRGEYQCL